jgi:apolipoprotein N-acyltransferase
MAQMGAKALITPSNDAYFGASPGAALNLSFSIFRAIELRMPVVRVTNSGVSALIEATGRIRADSRPAQFEPAVRTVSITPTDAPPSSISARSKGILVLALIVVATLIGRINGTGRFGAF